MRYALKPRHEAQMEHRPLGVHAGANGYRLAHSTGLHFVTVVDGDSANGAPLWFTSSSDAREMQREAEGAAAAMLAKVFG